MIAARPPVTPAGDLMARAVRCIAVQFGMNEASVQPEMRLGLYADSLDLVELSLALEDEFGVVVDDDALFAAKTVADVLALLRTAGVKL